MATKKKTATDQTKEKKSSSGRTPTSKKTGTKTSSGKKTGSQKNNTGKSSKKRQSVEVPDISRTRKTGTPVWAEVLLWPAGLYTAIYFIFYHSFSDCKSGKYAGLDESACYFTAGGIIMLFLYAGIPSAFCFYDSGRLL